MRISYKKKAQQSRMKRPVKQPLKAVITSAYELSSGELEELKTLFPEMKRIEVQNLVDPTIKAGVIVRIGTKQVDLSLERGLNTLQQYLYES